MTADTQSHIPIASLEEGVVIQKDGSVAVVLRIYPINFDLKNESEQNTIISRFQQFLNSLERPIQILVRSRQLDLRPYLADLTRRTASLNNELLKMQAEDYIKFVKGLVDVAASANERLMTKQYYVILQHQKTSVSSANPLPFGRHEEAATLTRAEFERIRNELNNQANNIAGLLMQMGLRIEALDTQQLIELFYSIYNPDIANAEQLSNIEDLQAEVVHAEHQTETAPGLTGSGDAISLTPTGSTNLANRAPAASVPVEAQEKAKIDEQKLPHAAAPGTPGAPAESPVVSGSPAAPGKASAVATPAPLPSEPAAAQTTSTPAATPAAPTAPAESINLNVPPAALQ